MDRVRAKPKLKREIRRRRHQSAWIRVDGEKADCECLVSDVSQGGAKIIIDAATRIEGRFGLALIPNHTKRQCEIIWRRGKTLGIKFIG